MALTTVTMGLGSWAVPDKVQLRNHGYSILVAPMASRADDLCLAGYHESWHFA
jgi:hypothetical protein